MNLGATLKNMVHDEIASRISAAKRSNGAGVTSEPIPRAGDVYVDREGRQFVIDNADLPASEWSPTIGQPEAANSNGHMDVHGTWHCPRDPYTTLRTILDAAFNHAATGKGKERHGSSCGRDLPFDKQPMLETTRLVGPGFPLGQAIKKAGEAAGMIERGELQAAEAECLGAINYLAGAVAWMRERKVAA